MEKGYHCFDPRRRAGKEKSPREEDSSPVSLRVSSRRLHPGFLLSLEQGSSRRLPPALSLRTCLERREGGQWQGGAG